MADSGGPPYRVSFEIQVDHLVDFLRLMQRRLNVIGAGLGGLLVAGGVYLLILGEYPYAAVLIAAGITTLIAAQTRFIDRLRARRQARSVIGTGATFAIGPTGIDVETEYLAGHIPWSGVTQVREDEQIIVLLRDRLPVAWIPASAFASAAERAEIVGFMRDQIAISKAA